jgi:hypothetical protein
MRDNKVMQAVAVAATLGAGAVMAFTESGGCAPRINPAPHRAVGMELAQQALAMLKPGSKIIVVTRNTTTFKNPATDILMGSFQRELRKAHVNVSAVQILELDPLRLIQAAPGDFQKWIYHATSGDVIVSFVGPPVLTPSQLGQLGEIKPAIVAFCPGGWPDRIDFRPLFQEGLLRTAIVSRRGQPAIPGTSWNSPDAFDQNFIILTAANVDDFETGSEKHSAANSP